MDLVQAVVLGIVQGLTEFVPISSSAHLVLIPWLLGWPLPDLVFDMMVHWGTLLALVVYFRRDLASITVQVLRDLARRTPLASPESRLGWLIVLATIPAAVAGYLWQDWFEAQFQQTLSVAALLFLNGLMLWGSETLGKRTRPLQALTAVDALLIGVAQAVAIVPSISRSGATIAMALVRDVERPAAARFSFLMTVPIILGAGLFKLKDALEVGLSGETQTLLAVGFVAAGLSGYACIALLLRFLATRSMRSFAVYCWLFGALCLLVAFLRR